MITKGYEDALKTIQKPDVINELVKLDSADKMKSFLMKKDKSLSDEDAKELSLKAFDMILSLKNMDEKQLEAVAGGGLIGDIFSAGQKLWSAGQAYTELKEAEETLDAAQKSLSERKVNPNSLLGKQVSTIREKKKNLDVASGMAFAAMASLGAIALLKIIRSSKP